MASYLLERDSINGKEGRAYATIDGRRVEIFQLKNLSAEANMQEADFKVVGTRIVQKKTTGVELTGTMTLYYGSPEFRRLISTYLKTGQLPYFTLQVVNDDPSSSIGRQTIVFYNVKLSSATIARLDADADWLEEDAGFSYTDFEILEEFTSPDTLGYNNIGE